MTPLPIDSHLDAIADAVERHRAAVVVAAPGAGKTTRVPPVIAARLAGSAHPAVVVLQPRRVAARATAERIARERGWRLGDEVGYHVRFDRRLGPRTIVRVLTEGILTRQLLSDPFLEGVGCVVLDEFHERSIHVDLALALLREVQQTVRPDLRLIVMSATLDAAPVATFLGGCPVVQAPGRTFPVEIEYSPAPRGHEPHEAVVGALAAVLEGAPPVGSAPGSGCAGDVLIFLPGVGEIHRAIDCARPLVAAHHLACVPLHGSLTGEEQSRALHPPADGHRKVVFATNIAETSLTIDGVTCVIDSGLHRRAGFDPRRGMDTLELTRISRASADQRAGRAGRTAPGRCIRLWSEREHAELAPFDQPEIARVDLTATVLAVHAWGATDPRAFGFFERPPAAMLASAERLLAMLGALDAAEQGRITELGRQMLAFPAHPRLARLLLAGAAWNAADLAASVAAVLSEKDFILDAPGDGGATGGRQQRLQTENDVLLRVNVLENGAAADDHLRIDRDALRQARRAREQFRPLISRAAAGTRDTSPGATDDERTSKLVLLAYGDRLCRMRDRERRTATMVGGGGVKLGAESGVVHADLFVAVDARHNPQADRAESIVRVAARVEPAWLDECLPHLVRRQRVAEFDPQRGRVVGFSRTWFLDLLIDEQPNTPVDDETAGRTLAAALADRASEWLARDDRAAALLARIDLLRRAMPEHPWPELRGAALADLFAEACRGRRSVEELASGALSGAIMSRLVYPLDRLLEEHAPESVVVPTGNRVRLRYAPGQPPVLAVRLQELFGQRQTPRVAGGRVPVKLELLGPNYRPVQVTDDLASFWQNTYRQVRKDLRARYPKHAWPEDPLTAPPQAKGRSAQRRRDG